MKNHPKTDDDISGHPLIVLVSIDGISRISSKRRDALGWAGRGHDAMMPRWHGASHPRFIIHASALQQKIARFVPQTAAENILKY